MTCVGPDGLACETDGMAFVGPAQSGPAQSGPVQSGPARGGPAQGGPVQGGPAHSGPARGGPAHGGTVLAGPVAVLADMVARQRPDSRRLRQLIAILTEGPQDLAALVERCALPRQTVESVLSAAADDLSWRDDKVMIQPGKAAAYRQGLGYEQLARTELADPLASRYARAATVVTTMESLVAEAPPARTDLDHVPATPGTVVRRALWLDSTYDLTG